MNQWEIIDARCRIDSGTEEEMRSQFNRYMSDEDSLDWDGDLKLIQIHEITR